MTDHAAVPGRALGAPEKPVAGRPGTDRAESVAPLLDALTAVAGAADVDAVCAAAVDGVRRITDARGAAFGVQAGEDVELRASDGYGCDSMGAGTTLPLDAGLPLTECVRTGRAVVRGQERAGGWIAMPVSTPTLRGGLLASLAGWGRADVRALQTLADATSAALRRCERAVPADLDIDAPAWLRVSARCEAVAGAPDGGDLVVCVPGATADVAWVVVADACGSGRSAAAAAAEMRRAITSLAVADLGPAELLLAADRWLRRRRVRRFVTAAALRLQHDEDGALVEVASAGHPPVLWRGPDGVAIVDVAGVALNLLPEQGATAPTQRLLMVPGDLLLAHTDGLVDRGALDLSDLLVDVVDAEPSGEPEAVADRVLQQLTELGGPPNDDVALAVVALREN